MGRQASRSAGKQVGRLEEKKRRSEGMDVLHILYIVCERGGERKRMDSGV